jgi:hypothetical protein
MSLQFNQSDVMEWLDQSAIVLRDILGQSQTRQVISNEVRQEFSSKLRIVAGVVSFLARKEQQGALTNSEAAFLPEESRPELLRRLAEIRTLALSVADTLRSRVTLLN